LENLFVTSPKGWTVFDLYYFSFHVINQIHQPDLPGVLVYPPPKKGSRGRDGDSMVLFLSLAGKTPYSPDELTALLQRAAQAYYQSSGSLTAGMKAAAEVCNSQLLERNLKNAREEGGQALGRLHLGVLRGNTLFMAVSGPAHAFLLGTQEVQSFYDAQAGRGLGSGASVGLRYFQTQIEPGDAFVFSPEPPASWTPAALAGCPTLTLEHLRRRLLNNIGPNLQAVVIKFQSGGGEIHALRHRSAGLSVPSTPLSGFSRPAGDQTPSTPSVAPYRPSGAQTPSTPTTTSRPSGAQAPSTPTGAPSHPSGTPAPSTPATTSRPSGAAIPSSPPRPPRPQTTSAPRPAETPPTTSRPLTRPAETHSSSSTPRSVPENRPTPAEREVSQAAALEAARLARQRRIERKRKAAVAWVGWKNFSARAGQSWHKLLNRLAPGRISASGAAQPAGSVSPALLTFIAIAVPLIVVAVALTVYLQIGRGERRTTLYEDAAKLAQQALTEKDPTLQRDTWNKVLSTLDKVDEYGSTEESRALRKQAQLKVDAGDAIVRMEFKPIGRVGLANAVKITKMISNNNSGTNTNDLYILDASNGSVLRFFRTAQDYELDNQFNCRPGPVESLVIGTIVDIAPINPVNKYNATIVAVDNGGNLLYCIPGKPPVTRSLAPPNVGWGKIAGIRLTQDALSLYVLDILGNAIWKYSSNDLIFQDRPSLYSEKFNTSLVDAVDFTLYEDFVYFLKKDGRMIQCKISRVGDIPTRCTDPAQFNDNRPGRDPKPDLMPGTHFTQLQSINAPDPSLYILDTSQSAVYRFSVVLNFQEQMRPSGISATPLPRREPSAFTITPLRMIFLAYGNQVFMAQMP
jgi:hypothetical protein